MIKMISMDTSTTASGVAVFKNGKLNKALVLRPQNKKEDKISQMVKSIWNLLDKENPDIIVIETPSSVRNAVTQRKLTIVYGSVFTYAITHNIEFNEMRPTEWRKWCGYEEELKECGQKTKKKADFKKAAVNKIGKLYPELKDITDDMAESILIGLAYINWFNSKTK